MKAARLIVAALLLASIFGGYYLYDQVWLVQKEDERKKAGLLLPLEADKVEKIRLIRPETGVLEMVKEKGVWRITKPFETEADQKIANRVTLIAEALKAEQDLGVVDNLEDFGLSAPVTLEFFPGTDGKTCRLDMGGREMITGGVYMAVNGGKRVSLVAGINADGLDVSFIALRQREFFQSQIESLTAFDYQSKAVGKLHLEKTGGSWFITSPFKAPASTVAVDRMANKFLKAKASGFHEENAKDLSPYGLLSPEYEFTAYFDGEATGRKMALGSKTEEGGVYALWPDGKKVARVAGDIIQDLPESLMDIRLRTLVSFQAPEVLALSVVSKSESVDIRRKSKGEDGPDLWEITAPLKTGADPVAVSGLLNSLKNLEAEQFPSGEDQEALARKALEKPDLEVALETKSGPVKARFTKSAMRDIYWAGADGVKEVMAVAASSVARLQKGVFELRERRLFTMASADVAKVKIERLGELFEIVKDVDSYEVTKPERIKIRHGEWTDFIWTLMELRFAGVINEAPQRRDDPSFGKVAMVISIYRTGDRLLERVEIAKSIGDDKWYRARLANRPGLYDVDWFYVEDDVTLALEKLLGKIEPKEETPGLFR